MFSVMILMYMLINVFMGLDVVSKAVEIGFGVFAFFRTAFLVRLLFFVVG